MTEIEELSRRVSDLEQKVCELQATKDNVNYVHISSLGHRLSNRALNVLAKAHLETVADIRRYGLSNLLRVGGCGMNTYNEIRELLNDEDV